jgi:hypothetical protein
MSHVHVKINFSFGIDSWNRCLSVHKRLQIRALSPFMEPRNRFQGMNSASLCSLAGRYDQPLPPRFLAPIDCLKIPALATKTNFPQQTMAEDLLLSPNCKSPGIDS